MDFGLGRFDRLGLGLPIARPYHDFTRNGISYGEFIIVLPALRYSYRCHHTHDCRDRLYVELPVGLYGGPVLNEPVVT